jgi:aminoglycoside 6'-N-acetyltransferase Ib
VLAITFRRLTTDDVAMLHDWSGRSHIAEWWGRAPSIDEVRSHYTPYIDGTDTTEGYIALADGEPVGFIQVYIAKDSGGGWWEHETDPGVRGIDQFLCNEHQLGQGLGSAMVRAFVDRLFEDPGVTRVQTDPSPDNPRAIRCYEKAGFRRVGEIDTPDGRAVYMVRDRPMSA